MHGCNGGCYVLPTIVTDESRSEYSPPLSCEEGEYHDEINNLDFNRYVENGFIALLFL